MVIMLVWWVFYLSLGWVIGGLSEFECECKWIGWFEGYGD